MLLAVGVFVVVATEQLGEELDRKEGFQISSLEQRFDGKTERIFFEIFI